MYTHLTPPPDIVQYYDTDTTHTGVQYQFGNHLPTERLVRITTEMVVAELGINTGNVFMEITNRLKPDVQGLAWDYDYFYSIDVLATLPEQSIIRVVAHELRHVWQYQNGMVMDDKDVPYYNRVQEVDAFSYEEDFWQRKKFDIYNAYMSK